MEIESTIEAGKCKLKFSGEMNIYYAAEIREAIQNTVDENEVIEVDLSLVTEIDTSGLQLLRAMYRSIQKHEKTLSYVKNESDVDQIIKLCSLGEALGY